MHQVVQVAHNAAQTKQQKKTVINFVFTFTPFFGFSEACFSSSSSFTSISTVISSSCCVGGEVGGEGVAGCGGVVVDGVDGLAG